MVRNSLTYGVSRPSCVSPKTSCNLGLRLNAFLDGTTVAISSSDCLRHRHSGGVICSTLQHVFTCIRECERMK